MDIWKRCLHQTHVLFYFFQSSIPLWRCDIISHSKNIYILCHINFFSLYWRFLYSLPVHRDNSLRNSCCLRIYWDTSVQRWRRLWIHRLQYRNCSRWPWLWMLLNVCIMILVRKKRFVWEVCLFLCSLFPEVHL